MKRGDLARDKVRDTIITAFGDNYVNTVDKKIYVEAEDGPGGEKLQYAITITLTKTPVSRENETPSPIGNPNDWSGAFPTPPATPIAPQLSAADKAKADELLRKLGF